MKRPLGYAQAAELVGVPASTLRSMVSRRQVPHIRLSARIVVFDVEEIETWLASKRVAVQEGSR